MFDWFENLLFYEIYWPDFTPLLIFLLGIRRINRNFSYLNLDNKLSKSSKNILPLLFFLQTHQNLYKLVFFFLLPDPLEMCELILNIVHILNNIQNLLSISLLNQASHRPLKHKFRFISLGKVSLDREHSERNIAFWIIYNIPTTLCLERSISVSKAISNDKTISQRTSNIKERKTDQLANQKTSL